MSNTSIQPVEPIAIQPLLASMKNHNDQQPKNSLPINTEGSIQDNAEKAAMPNVTLYNAHGILTRNKPNTLIAYA